MTADGQRLARSLLHLANGRIRAGYTIDREEVLGFGIASVRHPMTRRQRVALAGRLAYVALTGKKPR